jgi:hypothetical protein
MKCNFCRKEYTYQSVQKQYGTTHFAEYGCCSEDCYTKLLTGETPLEEPKEENK